MEIIQTNHCILCISIIISPKKFITISPSHYKHGSVHLLQQACNTRDQVFSFPIDLPKKVVKDIPHEVYCTIRQNGFLAEKRIENDIDILLFEYKHGNAIHEHKK